MRPDSQVLARLYDLFKMEREESGTWQKQRREREREKEREKERERESEKGVESLETPSPRIREQTKESELSANYGGATAASRPMVMADMLLREHFRANTAAACAPLRRYFEWRNLPAITTLITGLRLDEPLPLATATATATARGGGGVLLLDRLMAATRAVSGLLVDRLQASSKEMVQAALVDYVKTTVTTPGSGNRGAVRRDQPSVFAKANQPEPVRRVLAAFHGGLWRDLTMATTNPSRKDDSLAFMSDLAHAEHFQRWFRLQADYIGVLAIAEAVHTGALLRGADIDVDIDIDGL